MGTLRYYEPYIIWPCIAHSLYTPCFLDRPRRVHAERVGSHLSQRVLVYRLSIPVVASLNDSAERAVPVALCNARVFKTLGTIWGR